MNRLAPTWRAYWLALATLIVVVVVSLLIPPADTPPPAVTGEPISSRLTPVVTPPADTSTADALRVPSPPATFATRHSNGSGSVQPADPAGQIRTVNSTAYCLTGTMKDGTRASDGSVAVLGSALRSWAPMHSRWEVLSGPYAGRVLTVRDRVGHGSQFDVAMPGRCAAARQYGRRTIAIRRVA